MAKGLGAIMAQAAMIQTQDKLRRGEALRCPICGNVMDVSVSYFCYGDMKRDEYGQLHPCVETTHTKVREAFFAQFQGFGAGEEWQKTTIAAIVDLSNPSNPKILAELRTVRGPQGKTNMSCTAKNGVQTEDIPNLVKQFGWTFQDWYPDPA
jgi:hypothetical protein